MPKRNPNRNEPNSIDDITINISIKINTIRIWNGIDFNC